MCLIIKTEFDKHYINLLIVNEIMIILLNKYNQICFCNIIIYSHHIRNVQYNFLYVYFNYTVYIPL